MHRTLELTLYGRWCWMATPQGLKPDLNFSNPRLTWARQVPRVTKAVCDSGPPGPDRVSALKTALWYRKVTLFRKGKKIPTFPPHVRQDLFYHLGCRWELWSSPLLHRDNASVLLLQRLGHAKNSLWSTMISFILLWDINPISMKKTPILTML